MGIRLTIATLIAAAIYIAMTIWVARADYPTPYESPVAKPAKPLVGFPRTAPRQVIQRGHIVHRYDFKRASQALYYDGAGKWRLAEIDAPRRSCTGADTLGNSTTCGVLIEGQRVNTFRNTVNLTSTQWSERWSSYYYLYEQIFLTRVANTDIYGDWSLIHYVFPSIRSTTGGWNKDLDGLTLIFNIDGEATDTTVTFVGNGLTPTDVVGQINDQRTTDGNPICATLGAQTTSRFWLTSRLADGTGSIEIVGGTALANLGFSAGTTTTLVNPIIGVYQIGLTNTNMLSVYTKSSIADKKYIMALGDIGSAAITASTSWRRDKYKSSGSDQYPYLNFNTTTSGSDYISEFMQKVPQAEVGEFASSPIPNTSTTTSVTRAADELTVPTSGLISAKQGRLRVCGFAAYAYDALTATTGDPVILHAGADFKIIFDESENKFSFVAGGTSAAVATTFAADTEFCLDAVWRDKEKLQIRLNGGAWQYSAADYSEATLDAAMYIGSDATPANHFYGAITKLEVE